MCVTPLKNDRKTEKITEKNFLCQNCFPLILPKKHCLINQNRFWPFLGVLSGFLGVPQTIYFGGLSLYFENSLREKWLEVGRPCEMACCFLFCTFVLPSLCGLLCLGVLN